MDKATRIEAGDRIYVAPEKRPYRVRAANKRFAICTKPHFQTVLYFIVDLQENVRGTENLIFGFGAETDDECEEMLARLASGDTEVSHRNRVELDIVRHIPTALQQNGESKCITRNSTRKKKYSS